MLSEDSALSNFHCLVCGVWFRPGSFVIFVFMLQPIWSKQLTTGTILEVNLEEFHGIFSCRFIFPSIFEKDSGSVLRCSKRPKNKRPKILCLPLGVFWRNLSNSLLVTNLSWRPAAVLCGDLNTLPGGVFSGIMVILQGSNDRAN